METMLKNFGVCFAAIAILLFGVTGCSTPVNQGAYRDASTPAPPPAGDGGTTATNSADTASTDSGSASADTSVSTTTTGASTKSVYTIYDKEVTTGDKDGPYFWVVCNDGTHAIYPTVYVSVEVGKQYSCTMDAADPGMNGKITEVAAQ